jgi:hypothetical protein
MNESRVLFIQRGQPLPDPAALAQIDAIVLVDTLEPVYDCPYCGARSFNPHDITHRYCNRCHRFEDEPQLTTAPMGETHHTLDKEGNAPPIAAQLDYIIATLHRIEERLIAAQPQDQTISPQGIPSATQFQSEAASPSPQWQQIRTATFPPSPNQQPLP